MYFGGKFYKAFSQGGIYDNTSSYNYSAPPPPAPDIVLSVGVNMLLQVDINTILKVN